MGRLLVLVFQFILSDIGLKILSSLGLSIGTSLFVSSVIDGYINRAVSQLNQGFHSDVMAFANIARIDDCISIMIGGIVFVASYKSLKIFFKKG